MNKFKNEDLRAFLQSIPKNVVIEKTNQQERENELHHKKFISALNKEKCFLCKEKINNFNPLKPCFHWFTYPNGIKKKYFEKYLQKPIGFFQLNSYFRWLANSEKLFVNINDLKEEVSKTSYLEETIKYKNIEWAFSVGHTDLEGHDGGKVGSQPHFHIQMKVDDRIFLQFNDFHIPFSQADLFNIESLSQAGDLVQIDHAYGQGMNFMENEQNLELLDKLLKTTDDFDNAPFNRQTLIEAPEGQTFSGELVNQAIEENRRTNEPIGKILQRLVSDAKVITVISPGEGVPKMTKRSGKK